MSTDVTNSPATPPAEPATEKPVSIPWWTRGDTNAFFGLGFNILVNVLTLTAHGFKAAFGLEKSNGELRKQFITTNARDVRNLDF